MSKTVSVGHDDFEVEVLCADRPVVVEFWAEDCKACKSLSRIMPRFAEHMKIVACNVDENPEFCDRYGIMNVPTLLFFRDGMLVDRAIGFMNGVDESEVASKVDGVLAA